MEEKEIKLEILEKKSVEDILQELQNIFGFVLDKKLEMQDIYFDTDDLRYFNLNHAIRLRSSGNKSVLAYKALFNIPERKNNPWFIFEKEYDLPNKKESVNELLSAATLQNIKEGDEIDSETIRDHLHSIKLSSKIIINKTRYNFQGDSLVICVDIIKDLGIFIEIEGNSYEEIERIVEKIPYKYKRSNSGYTNLYAKRVLKNEIPDFDLKFKENPDWNFLPNQKEIVNKLLN